MRPIRDAVSLVLLLIFKVLCALLTIVIAFQNQWLVFTRRTDGFAFTRGIGIYGWDCVRHSWWLSYGDDCASWDGYDMRTQGFWHARSIDMRSVDAPWGLNSHAIAFVLCFVIPVLCVIDAVTTFRVILPKTRYVVAAESRASVSKNVVIGSLTLVTLFLYAGVLLLLWYSSLFDNNVFEVSPGLSYWLFFGTFLVYMSACGMAWLLNHFSEDNAVEASAMMSKPAMI
ncbi:hypothetical protein AAVH_03563 [Aphelenchoides avenae]|nr:hypothetical protein AAVH_03563 [Aphelenchus avenae]